MRISITQIVLAIFFTLNLYANEANSQGILDKTFSLSVENMPLSNIFRQIENQTGIKFVYSPNSINASRKINYAVRNQKIEEFLNGGLKNYNITYRVIEGQVVLYSQETNRNVVKPKKIITEPPARIVSGRVSNDKGEPLQGVTVSEKGTKNATITDEAGAYNINVEDNSVLEFTYIGYQAREISVGTSSTVNVVMANNVQDMNEVVVVGYGTQRKSNVSGSVDVIGAKSIEGRPVVNVLSALQGTAPGLVIQRTNFEPGQGANLNLRGISSLNNNDVLVVIDGVMGADINLLNPNDIENVSVLKDAGTAAIYGSRAANGVIIVTTKRGRKNEKPTVSYNGIYGTQRPHITYKPVDAWENAYYKNVSLVNSGNDPAFTPEQIQAFKEKGNGTWRLENLLQNAPQQSHNIMVRGGGANNTYLISLGMFDQRSNYVGPKYGYRRYNARLNQSVDIGKLKVTTILNYSKVNGKDHASSTGNLVVDASRVPLYYNFQDTLGRYLTNPVSSELNPLAILLKGGHRASNDDDISGNLIAEYQIFKDLKVRGVAGGRIIANNYFEKQNPIRFYPGGASGLDAMVVDRSYKEFKSDLQLMLDYSKRINQNHELGILFGGSDEYKHSEATQIVKRFTDPQFGVPITGTVIDPGGTYNSLNGTDEWVIRSLFGRLNYSYQSKYNAEFNFRYDGSSRFLSDKRWGFFPSAAASWRVSQESFFEPVKDYVTELKLRASYGILGNQNVPNYYYLTTFFMYPNAYGFNNTAVGGSGYNFGNPLLTWEKAATANFGVDMTLLKKLGISFDYFNKRNSDILFERDDIPMVFGAASPYGNVATVLNRGWDLKVTYNHSGDVLTHSIAANLADNLNEIVNLTSTTKEYTTGKEEYEFIRKVGQPATSYYGYKTKGYFQNLDQVNDTDKYPRFNGQTVTPGDLMFVDQNGDKVINEKDKVILGNPFPRYTYGLMYNLGWKNMDFQIFIQGVGKRAQMIRGEQVEAFHFGYGGTMYEHQTDFWTPTNPDARWPKLAEAGSSTNSNNYRRGSDLYLFNAAYARLKNVQIGYTIPKQITERIRMQKIRFYLTGQNLYTLSKLDFLDPEISEFNNNVGWNTGANSARAYPMPAFYGFGLDVTF